MPNVSKLKLLQYGVRGAIVSYSKLEQIGDFDYENHTVKENKASVPREIKLAVDMLRIHLLRMTGIWNTSWDQMYDFGKHELVLPDSIDKVTKDKFKALLSNCKITQVDFFSEAFILQGTYPRQAGGNVTLKLSTELVSNEHDYQYFDDILSILETLADDSVEFAEGRMIAEKTQIQFDVFSNKFIELDADEALKMFERIPEEKRGELIEQHNANNGKITLSLDDLIEPDGIEETEVLEVEPKAETKVKAKKESEPAVVEKEPAPEAAKEPVKAEESVMIPSEVEEDEGF